MLAGDDLTIVLFLWGTAITLGGIAVSVAGWRHPLLIGGLFTLAGICAVLGIAWPALRNVSPLVTAAVRDVASSPVAWFSILLVGMAAAILFRRPEAQAKLKPQDNAESASAPEPRIFIDVSPSYLRDLYKERTSAQGDALAAAYIGKWIRYSGTVRDVSIYTENPRVFVQATTDIKSRSGFDGLRFNYSWREKLSAMAKGDAINAIGKIDDVALSGILLIQCELS